MTKTLGKYQLLGRIAVGGMAEVFVARTAGPAGFSKTVAIKRIHPHLASDPTFVEMFIDEARVASRLTHPNIVQIIDLGEVDGEYFLAMEYLHGRTLGEVVARAVERGFAHHGSTTSGFGGDGVLPLGVVLTVAVNVLSALGYAHTRADGPVVHRDVSPHNILVAFDGHVKLVDFGIAKAKDRVHQTRAGVIKGKARYMPPEQLGGKRVDGRADLYALGAVLHEALTGAKLFADLSDGQLFDAKRVRHVEPPGALRPGVPAELDALVLSLLAHDRQARPPSCAAAVQAIERIMLKVRTLASNERVGEVMRELWSAEERRVPGVAAPPDPLRQLTTADGKAPASSLLDAAAFVEESTDAYLGRPPTPSVQRTREVADVPTARLERDTPPSGIEEAPTGIAERAERTSPRRGHDGDALAVEAPEGPTRPRGLEIFHAPTQLRAARQTSGRGVVALAVAGVTALAVAVVLAIGFARTRATPQTAASNARADPVRDPARDSAKDPARDPARDPAGDPAGDPAKDPGRDPARGSAGDPVRDPSRDPARDPDADPGSDPPSGETHTKTALRTPPAAPLGARASRPRPRRRAAVRPKRAMGRLELSCTPAARVFLGERALGRTPLSVALPAGRRRLRLRGAKPPFSYAVVVELRAGATTRERVRVPRARLRVGAVPWARVLIDGRFIDDTPIKPMWLYAGRHRVELVYPSGGKKLRHARVINVRGGEDLRVIHDFRQR